MRRADRLFQIIQVLRRSSKPVTAEAIAVELETSKRSIYRDIATLMAQRVPIRGEAGIGYVLDGGFDMPPLMLTSDEVEAAVLGAQWVAGRGDPALARAARDLIAKIAATVPEKLRPVLLEPAVASAPVWKPNEIETLDMSRVRAWIHAGRKLRLHYADEQGNETLRVIWPCLVGYRETKRLLVGWCETPRRLPHLPHRPGGRGGLPGRPLSRPPRAFCAAGGSPGLRPNAPPGRRPAARRRPSGPTQ